MDNLKESQATGFQEWISSETYYLGINLYYHHKTKKAVLKNELLEMYKNG